MALWWICDILLLRRKPKRSGALFPYTLALAFVLARLYNRDFKFESAALPFLKIILLQRVWTLFSKAIKTRLLHIHLSSQDFSPSEGELKKLRNAYQCMKWSIRLTKFNTAPGWCRPLLVLHAENLCRSWHTKAFVADQVKWAVVFKRDAVKSVFRWRYQRASDVCKNIGRQKRIWKD